MKTRTAKAFTLVEIMIVVAIIGIIIAIAVPAFMRARENARGRACQENLSKIDGAKIQYALETRSSSGTIPDELIWNTDGTGYLRFKPNCPADGSAYNIGDIGVIPTCPNYDPNSIYIKHTAVGTL